MTSSIPFTIALVAAAAFTGSLISTLPPSTFSLFFREELWGSPCARPLAPRKRSISS
jgi:hypothetical protein